MELSVQVLPGETGGVFADGGFVSVMGLAALYSAISLVGFFWASERSSDKEERISWHMSPTVSLKLRGWAEALR
jgi:hypothetical protein